jgi:putative transposase
MKEWQTLAHVKWECKYHIVIVPKYRRRVLIGKIKRRLGEILRQLCRQKGVEVIEGHICPDHVHMLVSAPPKYSIAMVIGYIKGKSSIQIHREFMGVKQGFSGKHFWARGYCISTVGLNETTIREYVKNQEKYDRQAELMLG